MEAANLTSGRVFRPVHKIGKAWGEGLTEKAVWHVVREYAAKAGTDKLAPHDLRRTCARLCHAAGGELEHIQFLLGYVSIQLTERYLAASSEFVTLSTTKLASSRLTEATTVCVRLADQLLVETSGSVRVARRFSQEPAMSFPVFTALRLMRSSRCRRERRSAALVLGGRQWSVADSLCHGDFSVGQFPVKLEAIDDSVGPGH